VSRGRAGCAAVMMNAAMGRTNASWTQESWAVEVCSDRWIAGRLTATVVIGR